MAMWPSLGAGGNSIRSVAWVLSSPSCFVALDAACTLHFFDLAKVCKLPLLLKVVDVNKVIKAIV